PIEKKPLFHFLPGTLSYSIACVGCNFKCDFCQNWEISQVAEAQSLGARTSASSPIAVIEQARVHECPSISYTYTEPTIYFEFAYDCAKIAAAKGIYNVFVTNGFMSTQALTDIAPYLDAANVDIKSFRDDFYQKICKGRLAPVLDTIKRMRELDIWVEATTLVIPGMNDSEQELAEIASFLVSVDKNIPWHVSAFHPDYRLTERVHISADVLEKAYHIGKEKGLSFVYRGNMPTATGENTYCPGCGKLIVERKGFFVEKKKMNASACGYCGHGIEGVWE
ncbi:MAG: AmmeMemoRadiSam system radical SAM enzyme, partial [Candidatus Omnitrophica bacterium]|nr:AmmeMemoRadiSam system radical SAM enzyme [Candidatus Omnitrophota bacterium]